MPDWSCTWKERATFYRKLFRVMRQMKEAEERRANYWQGETQRTRLLIAGMEYQINRQAILLAIQAKALEEARRVNA